MPQLDELRPIPRIHAYPASFGEDLARDLICAHTNDRDVVLDPFVGAGTTALQAILTNRYAIGIDVDPIACRISRVLTLTMEVSHLVDAVEHFRCRLRCLNTQLRERPDIYRDLGPGQEFTVGTLTCRVPREPSIAFWFDPSHMAVLSIVCALVQRETDPLVRQAFEVAISSAIIRKWPNTLSYAMDIDHSRPHKPQRLDILTIDQQFLLVDRIVTRVKNTVAAVQDAVASSDSSARILEGDAASQLSGLDADTVKFVLTSPPYLNAIDYRRAHKFSQWWLSPEQEPVPQSAYTGLGRVALTETDESCMPEISALSGSLLAFEDMAIYKNIVRYISDIAKITNQLYRVVTIGGKVALVVADNVIEGKVFPVSAITKELLNYSGFSSVAVTRRTIKTTRRRYPFGVNGFTGPMKNEYLVTADKLNKT